MRRNLAIALLLVIAALLAAAVMDSIKITMMPGQCWNWEKQSTFRPKV